MSKNIAVASVCVLLLVGCSDSESEGAEGETTTTEAAESKATTVETTVPPQPILLTEYFGAIGSPSPSAMVQLSAEGSPARAFADFEVASAEIRGALAVGTIIYDLEVDESSAELCVPQVPDGCRTFSDFEFDADGNLVDFTVNGEPVATTLAATVAPAVEIGDVSVELVAANSYRFGLIVLFEVAAADQGLQIGTEDVTYTDAGGMVFNPDTVFPFDAQSARSTELYQVRFLGADLGGELAVAPKVDGQPIGTATIAVQALDSAD